MLRWSHAVALLHWLALWLLVALTVRALVAGDTAGAALAGLAGAACAAAGAVHSRFITPALRRLDPPWRTANELLDLIGRGHPEA